MAESTSTPTNSEKPVIVRVKRKAFQTSLDAFWLEIQERPSKRPLVDFGKLSLSDSSSSKEELKTKKVLVRHVETIVCSEDTFSVLQSFVPNSSSSSRSKEKAGEGRHNIKSVDKQEQLLTKAKQKQEVLSRKARFEQIWGRRKGKQEAPEDDAIYDMCRLYDVVRVDVEENGGKTQMDEELDDCRIMAQYLPLLEEVLPSAAREVEDDIHDYMAKQASDGYVYDLYAVEDASTMETDSKTSFPLIQVEEDDYYDGPDNDSDYETDDSNAENNPLNDYPDEEETSEDVIDDDEEITSVSSSEEKSEAETSSASASHSEGLGGSSRHELCEYEEDSGLCEWSDLEDGLLGDEEEWP